MQALLEAFGINSQQAVVEKFGNGLINHTWTVSCGTKKYILQKVNHQVFKEPEAIAHNMDLLSAYFRQHDPGYNFVSPVATADGRTLVYAEGAGYFRVFPFVENSHTIDVVHTPGQAYEAASQFGRFTRLLQGFDAKRLKTTIPDFHNLLLRYNQFLLSLGNGNRKRIQAASDTINRIRHYSNIAHTYEFIQRSKDFKVRVIHHDTKISNVLFDAADNGICVIDLDTVMPGYFISDVGDMMRTYLSPVSEEEGDFSKIEVREEFYWAIVDGYYNEMKDVLTEVEKDYFFYAGMFMIYMQALRFLTDYLNDDSYYGEKYPGHNLVRANNQLVLLERLLQKELLLNRNMKMKVS